MAIRDQETTKSRILAAALREFSAKGIAGARVDGIAERAATNKRMLYYYFGSKAGLYREILRRRLSQGLAAVRESVTHRTHDLSAWQDYYLNNRDYVRLLMWEALETNARRPVVEEEGRSELYRQRVEAIAAEQEAGNVEADLDPAQLLLSEMAMTIFPAAFPQVTRLVTGSNPSDPKFIQRRREFFAALAGHLTRLPGAPEEERRRRLKAETGVATG
jgi:AcrR family transcriptional regulator